MQDVVKSKRLIKGIIVLIMSIWAQRIHKYYASPSQPAKFCFMTYFDRLRLTT